MIRTAFISLLAFAISWASIAQTLPDQITGYYANDKTPYPLYAGSFGLNLAFPDSDLTELANHFDAFYAVAEMPSDKLRNILDIKPDFQYLNYKGNWVMGRDDMQYVNEGHRDQMLHYRVGKLAASISQTDTVVLIDDMFGGLVPSQQQDLLVNEPNNRNEFRAYTTFIRMGSEIAKIVAVDGNRITLQRGLDNTQPVQHKAGTNVLSPVFGRIFSPETSSYITYRHDERSLLRWKSFLRSCISEYLENGSGIWIDILIGNLSQYTATGETVPEERIWNIETDTYYDKITRAKHAENGIRFVQETFFSIYNRYPVIWGNNIMFPHDSQHDRLRMLLQTENKPRPIDGFALENCFAEYGYGGHSGKEFSYKNYTDWQETIRAIMFLSELKVSARPLIMDGGIDNKKFAELPYSRRHELFLYMYASYLIAVKVEPDNKIYTMLGLCPVVHEEGKNPYIKTDPCFTWNIGKPIETVNPENYTDYNLKGTTLFLRHFENGIVVVNPHDNDTNTLKLSKISKKKLFDPETGALTEKVTLAPKRAVILLYQ